MFVEGEEYCLYEVKSASFIAFLPISISAYGMPRKKDIELEKYFPPRFE